MTNPLREDIMLLLEELAGTTNTLTVLRPFIDFTGSVDKALFLSQLIYWNGKGSDPEGWIYKSYQEWKDEIGVKEYTIRTAAKEWQKHGWLETKLKRINGSPILHYRIKKDALISALLTFLRNQRMDPEKSKNPSAETTDIDYLASDFKDQKSDEGKALSETSHLERRSDPTDSPASAGSDSDESWRHNWLGAVRKELERMMDAEWADEELAENGEPDVMKQFALWVWGGSRQTSPSKRKGKRPSREEATWLWKSLKMAEALPTPPEDFRGSVGFYRWRIERIVERWRAGEEVAFDVILPKGGGQ